MTADGQQFLVNVLAPTSGASTITVVTNGSAELRKQSVPFRQECSMILDAPQRHLDPDVSVLEFTGGPQKSRLRPFETRID